MTIPHLHVLAALSPQELDALMDRLRSSLPRRSRGRPWSRSLRDRVVIACTSLPTNLTVRELAAVFRISKSSAHRIIAALIPRLAALAQRTGPSPTHDRRYSWVVDGTLIPTRDHRCAARSKNYRWSCNAQVLARRRDLWIVAISAGGPGHRNNPIHYRGSAIEALCRAHGQVLADGGYRGVPELTTPVFAGRSIVRDQRWRSHCRRRARVEHAIARLKVWRVLRDHRRHGQHLAHTVQAVAVLHNLQIELRDIP